MQVVGNIEIIIISSGRSLYPDHTNRRSRLNLDNKRSGRTLNTVNTQRLGHTYFKMAVRTPSLHDMETFIRDKIAQENWTHSRLCNYLKRRYPNSRGISIRSIQRFCADKDIHKTCRLTTSELDEVVSEAIRTVSVVHKNT